MKYTKRVITAEEIARLQQSVLLLPKASRLADQPVCDFCGSTDIKTQYAASRLTSGEPANCWRWLACSACDADIDANNWLALAERIVQKLMSLSGGPRDVAERAVMKAIQHFFRDAIPEDVPGMDGNLRLQVSVIVKEKLDIVYLPNYTNVVKG